MAKKKNINALINGELCKVNCHVIQQYIYYSSNVSVFQLVHFSWRFYDFYTVQCYEPKRDKDTWMPEGSGECTVVY